MTVFRRVKRVRFKLVEGSSCKSLVLTGFFSASPFPKKMWICYGDRASPNWFLPGLSIPE